MAKKTSTALMFNPFGGIDTNPRRRNMSKAAGGAIGVGLVAGVAAIVATMVSSTSMLAAVGTEPLSGANVKSKAIIGVTTAVVAGVATYGIAKLAK